MSNSFFAVAHIIFFEIYILLQKKPLTNFILSKEVVKVCHASNIPVEAELGSVGGNEDGIDVGDNIYTSPKKAAEFVRRTYVDHLAVAIGTVHGRCDILPTIDLKRLRQIRQVVDVPLVLHGTSGIDDNVVRQCIKNGICKVNYATDLKIAFTEGIKKALASDAHAIDPKVYCQVGKEYMKQYVMDKIKVCGSAGKA